MSNLTKNELDMLRVFAHNCKGIPMVEGSEYISQLTYARLLIKIEYAFEQAGGQDDMLTSAKEYEKHVLEEFDKLCEEKGLRDERILN